MFISIYSYYLYEVSHPTKSGVPQVDLSNDSEALVNLTGTIPLSSNQLAVERVIGKVFTHYHCDVVITDRLRTLFTVKLWRMGSSFQSYGGRGRAKLLEKWKITKWEVELKENEIISKLKRKPDNMILQSDKSKFAKLEQDINVANKKLKEVTNQYKALQKSCKTLSATVKAKGGKTSTPKATKKKAWVECSQQYQRKRRRQIAKDVQTALLFTQDENFKPTRVELMNKETGKVMCIDENGQIKKKENAMLSDSDCNDKLIDQTLLVKERFNLSNKAYHEISMINSGLPRLRTLQNAAKNLDAMSTIHPTPGKLIGVQQSLKERLQRRIRHLVNSEPSFCSKQKLNVKLTGDGTYVSRSMHIVVIAFTLIHDETNSSSPMGNHTLALLNCGEEYDKLAEALKDLLDEIKNLGSLQVDGTTYHLEYFLGADMKFLAMCVGIESANSHFSCVWCKCPADERYDVKKRWSFKDVDKGARTIEEIQRRSTLSKSKKKDKFGYIRMPLFPTIPIDHIIPDILHLFLRISDVLINLLILDLRRLDGIEKGKLQSLNQDTATHLAKYEKFLNDDCKINFHMYIEKESKCLKWRDLTGPEKLNLFTKINIVELFPSIPKAEEIQRIWVTFFKIYNVLRVKILSEEKIREFDKSVKDWLVLFLSVYQTKHVTPYMHTLVAHIPEFLESYGSLAAFSQQGLEKLNDLLTNNYFRSTNHHHDALQQILLKLNRLEELEDSERVKQLHRCTVCHKTGHNSRICEKQ